MKRPYAAKVIAISSGISGMEGVMEAEEVMTNKPQVDENTVRTMQELLRQPPKRHDEMKLEKPRKKRAKLSPAPKRPKKP